MSDLASWPRRLHRPDGGAPSALWIVFGQFASLRLDSSTYRTEGIPDGMEKLAILKGATGFPDFVFTHTWAEVASQDHPGLLDRVRGAPEATLLQGTVGDDTSLDYLRDLVGLTTCLLDRGGVGVVDVLAFKWWTPDAFRQQLFLPRRPMPFQHVSILQSPQTDGRHWLHTRGLRLFGRPDISVRGVAAADVERAVELVNVLIARFAEGDVLPEGSRLDSGLSNRPATVHHRGSLDDPAFNNVHIEVVL